MSLMEAIPGTRARRRSRLNEQRETAIAEDKALQEDEKQAWVEANPEVYEREKVALEKVMAYKRRLIDAKEPQQAGKGREVRFTEARQGDMVVCFAQEVGIADARLYVTRIGYPMETRVMVLRPHGSSFRRGIIIGDGEDQRKYQERFIKPAVLGAEALTYTQSLKDSAHKEDLEFSVMAAELEKYFGEIQE